MTNTELYDLLAKGEIKMRSTMGIIPFQPGFTLCKEQIEESLRKDKRFGLQSFTEEEPGDAIARYTAEIAYLDEVYTVDFDLLPTSQVDLCTFVLPKCLSEDALNEAASSESYLQTTIDFYDTPINSFHFQLKVMDAIAPEAHLAIDFMSFRLLSPKWVRMTAQSVTPPSSEYLYAMHYVYEEDENGEKRYWLHSHGLHRCGCTELEIVDIRQGAEQMGTLLNTIIKNFMTDPKPELEQFKIGYDGLNLHICWQRWEDALVRFPENGLGGLVDRAGEDNTHSSLSGILFAVEEKVLISPEIYAKTLSENPIYFITNEETIRMSALATERFPFFRSVFEKENGVEEEGMKWRFLVKLGLQIDNDGIDSEKEHLWFEVKAIKDGFITGELINQPYWINNLSLGNVNNYPLELLTDWIIYDHDTSYTPDTIYELI